MLFLLQTRSFAQSDGGGGRYSSSLAYNFQCLYKSAWALCLTATSDDWQASFVSSAVYYIKNDSSIIEENFYLDWKFLFSCKGFPIYSVFFLQDNIVQLTLLGMPYDHIVVIVYGYGLIFDL